MRAMRAQNLYESVPAYLVVEMVERLPGGAELVLVVQQVAPVQSVQAGVGDGLAHLGDINYSWVTEVRDDR